MRVETGHGVGSGGRRCRCWGSLHDVADVAHLADTATNDTAGVTGCVTATIDVSARAPDSGVTVIAATNAVATTAGTTDVRRRVIVLRSVPLRHRQLLVLDGQTLYL